MNIKLLIAACCILFGLFTLVMRIARPDSQLFSKLKHMQKAYGNKAGYIIHLFAYSVVPILVGVGLFLGEMKK